MVAKTGIVMVGGWWQNLALRGGRVVEKSGVGGGGTVAKTGVGWWRGGGKIWSFSGGAVVAKAGT